jgi:hypothetical protein
MDCENSLLAHCCLQVKLGSKDSILAVSKQAVQMRDPLPSTLHVLQNGGQLLHVLVFVSKYTPLVQVGINSQLLSGFSKYPGWHAAQPVSRQFVQKLLQSIHVVPTFILLATQVKHPELEVSLHVAQEASQS